MSEQVVTPKILTASQESEMLSEEDSAQLFATMGRRQLTDAEAKMVSERTKWYHIRKMVRRIIETAPIIITALATMIQVID